MKRSLYLIIGLLTLSLFGCSEASYHLFNDIDRVQMVQENINYNFIYAEEGPDAVRDTVYITVMTIGYPRKYERKIDLKQITEYTEEIVTDEKGNIIDTLYHEVLNKAIPGVHYIAMDDPEVNSHLVIGANQVKVKIPVIVLKSEDLREQAVRLCLELVTTDDFRLGESTRLSQTIYIANNYSQPNGWTAWFSTYQFGKYSQVKHEFMTLELGMDINDDWFTMLLGDMSMMNMYKAKLKNALARFNSDPANIASGKAPMLDENLEQVLFP